MIGLNLGLCPQAGPLRVMIRFPFNLQSIIKMYFQEQMEKGKLFYRLAKLVGASLLVATLLHATFGTAEVNTAIKTGGIMPSMIRTLKNVWVFSSIMLFLSAMWVLILARDLGRLQKRAWWQGVLVGLGYAGGSIGAMFWAGVQGHLLAFALVGLILLLPLLIWARAFKAAP
jgi:hypothetical protein